MADRFLRFAFSSAWALCVGAGLLACDGSSAPGTGGGGAGGDTGPGGGGASAQGGSGGEGGMTAQGGGGSGSGDEFAVLVRGELFTTDMAMAKEKHDGIAAAGESAAKDAGDIAHDVVLGTTLLGSTENAFLAQDRWTDAMAMAAFYQNPDLQMAFGELFAAPPTVEAFQRQPTWHTWGDMTSGDEFNPYYWVVVRGHLALADPAEAQAAHDEVAGGGQAQAEAAGDVAHVVFTGLADPREFLAVDIWKSSDNIEALYTNPDFQAAFGMLFDAPPVVGVYVSTDWHQW